MSAATRKRLDCSAHHRAADEIAALAVANHLRAADATERAQRGHEINRFKDVCLALCVVAKQEVEAGRNVGIQSRIIAEVAESQMGQMHSEKIGARAARPRAFSQSSRHDCRGCQEIIRIIPTADRSMARRDRTGMGCRPRRDQRSQSSR